jgi:heme/copper-type cytochrome/quinol oxidase subunit 3
MTTQKHPFHLVDPSPWPLVGSTAAFMVATGSAMIFHGYDGGSTSFQMGMVLLLLTMIFWWRDVIREGTFEGQHTHAVQLGLRLGMILFIASEVMFFFAFFWAFFWSSLAPTPEIGGIWPPKGIPVLSAWEIPFLNTLILLTSGATVTWAHHAICARDGESAHDALIFTVLRATLFTYLQYVEYCSAGFTINDSVYGSTFYMATGFHGFHVFIGTVFRTVCLVRLSRLHFTSTHHFGFEAAAWYWHFVDVVWLFLFIAVYAWGGL